MNATKTKTSSLRRMLVPKPLTFDKLMSFAVRYLIALILILFAVAPALWVISASLNPAKSLVSGTLFPKDPGLTNYDQLLNNEFFPYKRWFLNSLIVATITTGITLSITALSGYALSRFRFNGRRSLMVSILILNVFPSILAMVALYAMIQQLGMHIEWLGLDNYAPLIFIYVAGNTGINVLMVKAYVDSIPTELDESAMIDGASHGQIFRHIILPIMTPIVITVGVLTFIAAYGDFVIARVLLKSSDQLTVMVGLMLFQTDRFDRDFGMISAGAVLAAIPIILIYLPLQRYVIDGLTAGAIKG